MNAKPIISIATGLLLIGLVAFAVGRHLRMPQVSTPPPATSSSNAPAGAASDYRELPIRDILALPFPQFYEALEAAPAEAREEWSHQIEAMPKGPQRTAALAGFCKLLVQLDPDAAGKIVASLQDRDLQFAALDAVVKAAPVSALPKLAECVVRLPRKVRQANMQDFMADLLYQWSEINPAAVADFINAHEDAYLGSSKFELLRNWSAIDPEGAMGWMDQQDPANWQGRMEIILPGWYQNDHTAALKYTLAHLDDDFVQQALAQIVVIAYEDSREDAQALIASLPDDLSKRIALHGVASASGLSGVRDDPKYSPKAVADWMLQYSPKLWRSSLTGILEDWLGDDQEGLIAWIAKQPPQIRNEVAAEYPASRLDLIKDSIVPVLAVADADLRDRLLHAVGANSSEIKEIIDKVRDSSLTVEEKENVLRIMSQVEREQAAHPKKVPEPVVVHSYRDDA